MLATWDKNNLPDYIFRRRVQSRNLVFLSWPRPRTKAWDINPFLVPFTESVVELARIDVPRFLVALQTGLGDHCTRLTLA
jgi:hypothetical protein